MWPIFKIKTIKRIRFFKNSPHNVKFYLKIITFFLFQFILIFLNTFESILHFTLVKS